MLVRREAASMRPRDDVLRVAAAAGGAHPQPSSSGQHRTVRQGGNVRHRLEGRRGDVGFGPSHRDGGNRTVNVEGGVGRNETLNVEGGVRGECRVMNRRAERWRTGLKGRDDVSELRRERRPDEPGKAP
jgi:hypothetical protein